MSSSTSHQIDQNEDSLMTMETPDSTTAALTDPFLLSTPPSSHSTHSTNQSNQSNTHITSTTNLLPPQQNTSATMTPKTSTSSSAYSSASSAAAASASVGEGSSSGQGQSSAGAGGSGGGNGGVTDPHGAPGSAWNTKKAQEDYDRAVGMLTDKAWSMAKFGEILDLPKK